MPCRKIPLVTGEVYHIVNRGVAKNPIFLNRKDYQRFINLINFYRRETPPMRYSYFNQLTKEDQEKLLKTIAKHKNIVEVISFCLMPNHIHLLVKQISENGIFNFMRNIQNGYAKYFNIKSNRTGPLFESRFKAVRIETDEQLLHVSRYIHLNPFSSYLVKIEDLENYPWSSLSVFLNNKIFPFIETEAILSFFKKGDYRGFVFDQADHQRKLEDIKNLILE